MGTSIGEGAPVGENGRLLMFVSMQSTNEGCSKVGAWLDLGDDVFLTGPYLW